MDKVEFMMKKKFGLNGIALLNITSTLLLQGIAFLSTPIFTRLLGPTQFGIYSLFNSWVQICTCFMGLGMASALGSGLYVFKERYFAFRNSVLLVSTILGILEILLMVVLYPIIIVKISDFSILFVVIIGITSLAHYIVNFAQTAFIYEKNAIPNFILSIFLSAVSVAVSVILIYKVDIEIRYIGRIYGITITYCTTAVLVWVLLFLKKPIGFNKEFFKYGFTVGFPIIFHLLAQQLLGQADRIMMQAYGKSSSEIGIYSLFYTLSSVLLTVLTALNNSWCPFYYDDVSHKKWDELNKKSKNYIELFTILAIGFLLLSREVAYLMADKSYWDGIDILPILSFAMYFTFMYQFPVNFEFFYKKTKIIAMGTFGAGVVNVILNAIMIPIMGMYGAAIATALSYMALFLVHFYIVRHMKNNPYHLKITVFFPGLLGMTLGVVLFFVLSSWWYIRWGIGMILGCFEVYRIYKRKSIF